VIRAVTILLLTIASTVAQDRASANKQVDQVFAKWDSTTSPGCALSVIKDGEIVYKRGYGMADLDHDVPITSETVFHVASISKQFTAAAILLLAQEGKLSLDDDVRKYITELPDFGARITIRHCFTIPAVFGINGSCSVWPAGVIRSTSSPTMTFWN